MLENLQVFALHYNEYWTERFEANEFLQATIGNVARVCGAVILTGETFVQYAAGTEAVQS